LNHIISISETHSEEILKALAEEQINKCILEAQLALKANFSHNRMSIDIVSMDHNAQKDYLVTYSVLLSGRGHSKNFDSAMRDYKSMKIFNTDYFRVIFSTNDQARESITHKIRNKIISKATTSIDNFIIDNNNQKGIENLDIIFGNFKNYSKKRQIEEMRKLNE
jgi:hypothetical protein